MYLTKRQSELLDYLRQTIATQGYAPSLEEMAEHFELSSVGTVHKHLKALEEKGAIRRQWNRSRAIEIVESSDGQARRIPVLGRFRDGFAIQEMPGARSVSVPEDVIDRGNAYVLVVHGDDLKSGGLCDGDFLIVRQQESGADGDLVIVERDGSTMMRRVRGNGGALRFEHPSDTTRSGPPPAECKTRGVVVGIQRRFA